MCNKSIHFFQWCWCMFAYSAGNWDQISTFRCELTGLNRSIYDQISWVKPNTDDFQRPPDKAQIITRPPLQATINCFNWALGDLCQTSVSCQEWGWIKAGLRFNKDTVSWLHVAHVNSFLHLSGTQWSRLPCLGLNFLIRCKSWCADGKMALHEQSCWVLGSLNTVKGKRRWRLALQLALAVISDCGKSTFQLKHKHVAIFFF